MVGTDGTTTGTIGTTAAGAHINVCTASNGIDPLYSCMVTGALDDAVVVTVTLVVVCTQLVAGMLVPLTDTEVSGIGKLPLRVTVVGPLVTHVAGVTESIVELCTGEATVGAVTAAQLSFVIVFESSVTPPVRATSEPFTCAPVVAEIAIPAMMCPTNVEEVPSVAEVPTSQKTLQAWVPLVSVTVLPLAVLKSEAVSKINTAFGFPPPLRV